MLLPLVISGTLLISPLAYVQSLGTQVQRVDVVQSLPGGGLGYVSYRKPSIIQIREGLQGEQLKYVLTHEYAHAVFFQLSSRPDLQAPFGKAPFITPYAKQGPQEDAAEVAAYVLLKKPIPKGMEKKVEIVKSVLGH